MVRWLVGDVIDAPSDDKRVTLAVIIFLLTLGLRSASDVAIETARCWMKFLTTDNTIISTN
jgi:hypothetical protein